MEEKNIRQCKKCNQLRPRVYDGKFPDGKNNRWLDDTGRLWNGNTCGQCHNTKMSNHMKVTRNAAKTL